jgi:hypothetical protein
MDYIAGGVCSPPLAFIDCSSLSDAVAQSAVYDLGISDLLDVEGAEVIYQRPDGTIGYTTPESYDPLTFDVGGTPLPPGAVEIGVMHSHTTDATVGVDAFSNDDIVGAASVGVAYYMVDETTGNIQELDSMVLPPSITASTTLPDDTKITTINGIQYLYSVDPVGTVNTKP